MNELYCTSHQKYVKQRMMGGEAPGNDLHQFILCIIYEETGIHAKEYDQIAEENNACI